MRAITSIIIIAASLLVFFVFVVPNYQSLQTLRKEVADYTTRLSTAEEITSSREELISRYNNISKADLEALQKLLPDQVDNIRLIIQLDALATKNGLSSLRNVTYDTKANEAQVRPNDAPVVGSQKPYGSFTLSFETAGQYKNFLSFISDLERNLRLVDIVAVDFSATEFSDRGFVDSARYRITVKTYWLK